jgi:Interferon-related developmental regulator (IFRD)
LTFYVFFVVVVIVIIAEGTTASCWNTGSTSTTDNDVLIRNGGDPVEAAEAAARDSARRLQVLADSLSLLTNMNYEKRAVVRERLLKQNFHHLATTAQGWEILVPTLDSAAAACRNAYQRGGPAEQYAACRVLEVMCIIIGRNEEDFVENAIAPLRQRASTKETTVQRAVMRTYATSILVCAATDASLRNAALDWYESFVATTTAVAAAVTDDDDDDDHHRPAAAAPRKTIPDVLQATAWDCWSLLTALMPDEDIAGEHEGRGPLVLEAMLRGLDSDTPELRSAAGQAATLVHEARLALGSDEGNVTARQFQRGSWDGSAYEDTMNEIQQRVEALAVESGKKSTHGGGSGGNRKVQRRLRRATFREYAATLVENESPDETVHVRNTGRLEITTWKDLIVLNHLRQCLQSGFQVQLLSNPTIQAMLGVDQTMITSRAGGGGGGMNLLSAEEKRVVLSKTSVAVKTADQDRRGKRDKRENVKNHFLTADHDDDE